MTDPKNIYHSFVEMQFPIQWGCYSVPMPLFKQTNDVKQQQQHNKRKQLFQFQKCSDQKNNMNNNAIKEIKEQIKVQESFSILQTQTQKKYIQTNKEFSGETEINNKIKFGYSQELEAKIEQRSSEKVLQVWTVEEEKKLVQYVNLFGKKWKYIASFFPEKNTSEVRNKYLKRLCPQSNNKWTQKQNIRLIHLIKQYGRHSWKKISQKMQNKTQNQLKNQYYGYIKNNAKYQQFLKWQAANLCKQKRGRPSIQMPKKNQSQFQE